MVHPSCPQVWALQHVPGLREAVQQGEVLFGCIDTWLIYKLTGKHLTEVSNIAASGFYDPFIMQSVFELSDIITHLSKVRWLGLPSLWHPHVHDAQGLLWIPTTPVHLLLQVVSSCGSHFGETKPELLGGPVPLLAVLAGRKGRSQEEGERSRKEPIRS